LWGGRRWFWLDGKGVVWGEARVAETYFLRNVSNRKLIKRWRNVNRGRGRGGVGVWEIC